MEALIPRLRRENARGFDVYITPIDERHHFIVVDDMTSAKRQALKEAGYRPSLIQQSSADNEQAVLRVPRSNRLDEQEVANELVRDLNRFYGDPKFSGVIHPFRMAGFSNRKAGKGLAFTRIVEATPVPGHCGRAQEALQKLRAEADQRRERQELYRREAQQDLERRQRLRAIEQQPGDRSRRNDVVAAYRLEVREIRTWVKAKGLEEDWSRIDWRASKELLKAGWKSDQVEKALLEASPDLNGRHQNPQDYVQRTVQKAGQEPDVVQALQEKLQKESKQSRGRGHGLSR